MAAGHHLARLPAAVGAPQASRPVQLHGGRLAAPARARPVHGGYGGRAVGFQRRRGARHVVGPLRPPRLPQLPAAFVIMENLRLLLSLSPPYGVAFTGIRTGKYQLRTSTGYVISREAVQELVIKGRSYALCRDAVEEDDGLVFCMAALEGNFFVAEDGRGLPLMYELPPEALMENILQEGVVDNCCSVKPALFHGLSPSEMRATHYLLYHLKPQPPMTSITCLSQQ